MVWIVSCVFFHSKAVYPIPSQLVSMLLCAYSAAPATMSVNTRDATSKSGRWEQLRLVYLISTANQNTSKVFFDDVSFPTEPVFSIWDVRFR